MTLKTPKIPKIPSFQTYLDNPQILEGINDKGIFKAIFLAGTPGAGKSTMQKALIGGVSPKIVNTDKFVRDFYGIKKEVYNIFTDVAPDSVVKKAISLTQAQLFQYINSMLPLIIDSTSSNPSNLLKRNGMLQSFGYDTGMIYVKTSLETAIRRNEDRKKAGNGGVPEEFLKSTYEKLESMLDYYKEHFKFFKVVENEYDNAYSLDFNKIYKDTQAFFSSPVKNPIGRDYIQKLKAKSGTVLSDITDMELS